MRLFFNNRKNINTQDPQSTSKQILPNEIIEPIEDEPRFNLVFHFHCVDHEKVWYAIAKLEQHISKFNGYKIFTLSSPNNVFINNAIFKTIITKFKDNKTLLIPVQNDLETRESDHFFRYAMPVLISLADMPNKKSYTFYGHSKGCTHKQKDYAITCWVNTLYKYNLDMFEELIKPNLLINKYKFIGCLKVDSGTLDAKTHYAGTFFWFDSDITRCDWYKYRKHKLALEMWPNTIVHNNDMLCIWNTDPPVEFNFYRMDYWYNLVFANILDKPTTITGKVQV
jgi:hypothetical protein